MSMTKVIGVQPKSMSILHYQSTIDAVMLTTVVINRVNRCVCIVKRRQFREICLSARGSQCRSWINMSYHPCLTHTHIISSTYLNGQSPPADFTRFPNLLRRLVKVPWE